MCIGTLTFMSDFIFLGLLSNGNFNMPVKLSSFTPCTHVTSCVCLFNSCQYGIHTQLTDRFHLTDCSWRGFISSHSSGLTHNNMQIICLC